MKKETEKTDVATQQKTEVAPQDNKATLGLIQATLNKDWKTVPQETRLRFIARLCEQLNISPVLNPFKFIDMKGITVLYAPAAATALIANANRISQEILKETYDKEKQILKIYIRSSQADGRFTDEYASLYLGSNSGENRANLEMKCLTKAKRRGVLAMVNMSIPDEDELEYLENASHQEKRVQPVQVSQIVDTVEKEDVDEARIELMDLVTEGDSKKMNTLKTFIAYNTGGKVLSELTYDECHKLMHIFTEAQEELKKIHPQAFKDEVLPKPTPSEDNDIPEVQEEMFSKEDIEKGPFA